MHPSGLQAVFLFPTIASKAAMTDDQTKIQVLLYEKVNNDAFLHFAGLTKAG
jgi:hypothetical protein